MTLHDDATDTGCSISGEHDTLKDDADVDLSFLDRKSDEFLRKYEKEFNPYEERDTSPKPFLKKENIVEIADVFIAASNKEELGSALSSARERAGLSQNQLAKIMGTDHRARLACSFA